MVDNFIPWKWVIGGIALLIIFAGACYLWYQYDTEAYRKAADETAKFARQWEATQELETDSKIKQASDIILSESSISTAEKLITAKTPEETAAGADIRVSSFGFGPYPHTTDKMVIIPWERFTNPDHELVQRVRIKLWKEGVEHDGASMNNGLIYPIIRKRVYIRTRKTGSNISYTDIIGHPDDKISLNQKIPDLSGFDVYTFDDGINPYSYLELERNKK